jgi:tetratricopeptide (TPR) repeat protein
VEAAIRDYQTLLLANPKDSLAMASMMAVANYSPEVAESQLKIMMREEPDSPYLNFALANVYGAQNRWIEAQGLYFTALEHNPNDPNYAYNLAVSLEHIEKPEVAIAYYERALDNFNNGLATFNRDVVDQRLEKLKQL